MINSDVISIISIVVSLISSIISLFAITNVVKIKQEFRGRDINNNEITMVGGSYIKNNS